LFASDAAVLLQFVVFVSFFGYFVVYYYFVAAGNRRRCKNRSAVHAMCSKVFLAVREIKTTVTVMHFVLFYFILEDDDGR